MMFSKRALPGFLGIGLTIAALCGPVRAQAATTYYVATAAGGGNDANTGLDSAHPVATFKHALALVGTDTGDTIKVASGTYQEAMSIALKTNLTISGVGSPHLISLPTNPSGLNGSGNYALVQVYGCNGLTVGGFIIDGGKANNGVPDAGDDCNGVAIGPQYGSTGPITPSYHINIAYNTVQNVGGAGIATNTTGTKRTPNFGYGCDYVTVTGNFISNTNSTGQYGSSGISFLDCVNSDSGPGYHSTIQNNTVCNSYVDANAKLQTDGNGIIIDSGGQSTPPTVIQNNIVYDNSGRGIYVFNASNVSILNNTCYQNCRNTILAGSGSLSIGEIVSYSEGVGTPPSNINLKIYNNATVTRGVVNGLTIANYVVLRQDNHQTAYPIDSSVVLSSYNSWYNGQNNLIDMPSTPTLLHLYPLFTNSATGDFSEASGSPTINAGTNTVHASADFLFNPRPYNGGTTDLGAYESQLY